MTLPSLEEQLNTSPSTESGHSEYTPVTVRASTESGAAPMLRSATPPAEPVAGLRETNGVVPWRRALWEAREYIGADNNPRANRVLQSIKIAMDREPLPGEIEIDEWVASLYTHAPSDPPRAEAAGGQDVRGAIAATGETKRCPSCGWFEGHGPNCSTPRYALARSQPKTRPLHCASVDPICHHPACSCVGTGSIPALARSQPESEEEAMQTGAWPAAQIAAIKAVMYRPTSLNKASERLFEIKEILERREADAPEDKS